MYAEDGCTKNILKNLDLVASLIWWSICLKWVLACRSDRHRVSWDAEHWDYLEKISGERKQKIDAPQRTDNDENHWYGGIVTWTKRVSFHGTSHGTFTGGSDIVCYCDDYRLKARWHSGSTLGRRKQNCILLLLSSKLVLRRVHEKYASLTVAVN